MADKRRDKNRAILKSGERYRETDGRYSYRWTDAAGKRHEIYARTLPELREAESEITKDSLDGVKVEARNVTLNHIYKVWKDVKRGLKDTTFQNYCYMYETFVMDFLGKQRISNIKKTDVRKFYISLSEERGLQLASIDSVHTIVHQLFGLALEDGYIRSNPADGALKEIKMAAGRDEKKKAVLTQEQEEAFLGYLRAHREYSHWYPIFAIMAGTGMRVGEVTGLRWQDVDLKNGTIDINHTLVYYSHRIVRLGEKQGSYYAINSTKTPASKRVIPMLDSVKEAFLMEKDYQEKAGLESTACIDGYTGFVFVNRFGGVQQQSTLNKALRRIVRDYNIEAIDIMSRTGKPAPAMPILPNFSCHALRRTFATRMCENGVNIKVIQDALGHADVGTTLNIYTVATMDAKFQAFREFEEKARRAELLEDQDDDGENGI